MYVGLLCGANECCEGMTTRWRDKILFPVSRDFVSLYLRSGLEFPILSAQGYLSQEGIGGLYLLVTVGMRSHEGSWEREEGVGRGNKLADLLVGQRLWWLPDCFESYAHEAWFIDGAAETREFELDVFFIQGVADEDKGFHGLPGQSQTCVENGVVIARH